MSQPQPQPQKDDDTILQEVNVIIQRQRDMKNILLDINTQTKRTAEILQTSKSSNTLVNTSNNIVDNFQIFSDQEVKQNQQIGSLRDIFDAAQQDLHDKQIESEKQSAIWNSIIQSRKEALDTSIQFNTIAENAITVSNETQQEDLDTQKKVKCFNCLKITIIVFLVLLALLFISVLLYFIFAKWI